MVGRTAASVPILVDMGKGNAKWRRNVAKVAKLFWKGDPTDQPVRVDFLFVVERPIHHLGTGRNKGKVRRSARVYPTIAPDAIKFARSTEDALTGIVWEDDAANVDLSIRKRYGTTPGVLVRIYSMPPVAAGEADIRSIA